MPPNSVDMKELLNISSCMTVWNSSISLKKLNKKKIKYQEIWNNSFSTCGRALLAKLNVESSLAINPLLWSAEQEKYNTSLSAIYFCGHIKNYHPICFIYTSRRNDVNRRAIFTPWPMPHCVEGWSLLIAWQNHSEFPISRQVFFA